MALNLFLNQRRITFNEIYFLKTKYIWNIYIGSLNEIWNEYLSCVTQFCTWENHSEHRTIFFLKILVSVQKKKNRFLCHCKTHAAFLEFIVVFLFSNLSYLSETSIFSESLHNINISFRSRAPISLSDSKFWLLVLNKFWFVITFLLDDVIDREIIER